MPLRRISAASRILLYKTEMGLIIRVLIISCRSVSLSIRRLMPDYERRIRICAKHCVS